MNKTNIDITVYLESIDWNSIEPVEDAVEIPLLVTNMTFSKDKDILCKSFAKLLAYINNSGVTNELTLATIPILTDMLANPKYMRKKWLLQLLCEINIFVIPGNALGPLVYKEYVKAITLYHDYLSHEHKEFRYYAVGILSKCRLDAAVVSKWLTHQLDHETNIKVMVACLDALAWLLSYNPRGWIRTDNPIISEKELKETLAFVEKFITYPDWDIQAQAVITIIEIEKQNTSHRVVDYGIDLIKNIKRATKERRAVIVRMLNAMTQVEKNYILIEIMAFFKSTKSPHISYLLGYALLELVFKKLTPKDYRALASMTQLQWNIVRLICLNKLFWSVKIHVNLVKYGLSVSREDLEIQLKSVDII